MDAQTFNAFLEGKLNDIRDILASKGAEYVPEGTVEKSRFHNFEVSAALNGSTKEQALWGFVTKHIVSLADMIKDEPLDHSLAKWDEKIGDISVYMVLLHAMVYEAHDNADMVKVAMKEYADHVSSLEDVSVKSDDIPPPEDPPTDVGATFYPSGLKLISDIEEQERKRDVASPSRITDMAIHTEPVNHHTSVGVVPNDHIATPSEPYSSEERANAALQALRKQENKTPDEDKPRIEKVDEPSTEDVQSDVVYPEGYEGIRKDLENKTVQAAKINIPEGLSDADKQHRAWMARVTPPQHS